jgi:hypothetical protein
MLIASSGFREFMPEMKLCSTWLALQQNGYSRAAGRDRFATRISVSKRDLVRRTHLQHFAERFNPICVTDIDFASGFSSIAE